MKILLDTHILLWAALGAASLPALAAAMIEDGDNDLYFSPASIWEIAIKGKLEQNSPLVDARLFRQNLLANRYQELPINGLHAAYVRDLPHIHKDPFDRILVAQSTLESLVLVTADRTVARYPGTIQKV